MTTLPHRYRLQFGRRDPHGTATARIAGILEKPINLAERFMAYRRAKLEADQSVDTFMRRGESNVRFAYFND